MDFTYKDSYDTPVPEAYETLLLEVLEGNASMFMRADQVEEAWRVIKPIMEAWEKAPAPRFPNYDPGSWGPKGSNMLIRPQSCSWTLLPENGFIKNKLRQHL
jgi:glucose-6-phosphate 1-dehydrogenase